ncbi:hypothetical protein SERLA73DRAFT_162096 [Serpula lacrymans var. lacrymans S7.3]|uniref:Bacteriophage T5 Orf172 DNA-binding domain-containing protein n=2 Tax=Serpula lacrymans var. lacrymans TaxID=341189 RepID=F8Q6F7_SERL3|nr:uncharacterized protein SERLADRAFT_417198 [Serpula lacrymans var. lacrymans S7.9]EGN96195.1 hypothetical protein SERLA73DRAFT_162096 [Serpula lacrymans var. lacrymans S7.3]EGO21734.1 hypothetical protein SERLADRAFT_417198 [Serpula lacrymans var. lacrymans S7.9]
MEKSQSPSDVAGYIYTFEIRDPKNPRSIQLKVGRAVNLVKRLDQWGKQCGSKEQVLRGWWPGTVEDDDDNSSGSLMKGRIKAGEKGPLCHRLERLVHLELADLAAYAPYLDPKYPNCETPVKQTNGSSASPAKSKSPAKKVAKKPCLDCGTVHREIFTFPRAENGRYKGREWELIVQPVIEKWGGFVADCV